MAAPGGLLVVLAALLGLGQAVQQVPVVLWHGMGDSCYNDFSMGEFARDLQKHLGADAYVKTLCFGDSASQDAANGFLLDANTQVAMACEAIASDERLRQGYHAVGLSQGGQFLRAVAQRCPSPPMKVLVSLGGQHQGVYGLPHCTSGAACNAIRHLLSVGAYWGWVQRRLVQAQYWHDARHLDRYRAGSTFLADINNDVAPGVRRNASYAANLAALERLVLVRFNQDSMVVPVDSQWFQFYEPGSTSTIQRMEESALYKEDWVGLQTLHKTGRLVRIGVDGDHLEFSSSWFYSQIVDPYLKTAGSA